MAYPQPSSGYYPPPQGYAPPNQFDPFGGAPSAPGASTYGGVGPYAGSVPGSAPPNYGGYTNQHIAQDPHVGYGGTGGMYGDAFATQPGFAAYAGPTTDVPLATPVDALPTAADQPVYEAGWKDTWAAVLFWIHALVIVILAFALGVPAIKADASRGDKDPTRQSLDFNSSLFIRMMVLGLFVAAGISVVFFFILKRFGAHIIKCALYTSVAVQIVMTAITFAFAPVAGVVLLISAAITICYIYFVRNRIPFAAAHLETAIDVVRAYPSIFLVALVMLAVQTLWIFFWAAAAFGIQRKINGDPNTQQNKHSSGGVMVFFLLISFFWGVLVFRGIVHYVTASVVGNWWFLGNPPAAVRGSFQRAFTTNFGSIAFGALISAVIRALETMARNTERKARQSNKPGAAFAAACAVCLLACVRRAVDYFNEWALIYVALTGANYTRGGKEAINLFTKRGWSAVINDDLTGSAMAIVALMIAIVSGVISGGTAYLFMGSSDGVTAGIIGSFGFFAGLAMAITVTGIVTSAVRTVFVCFAMNPAALAATHPNHLNVLASAWHKAHPQEFTSCGYAAAYYPNAV